MSNVNLQFCISKAPDCSYLTMTDNTGQYTANNTGGWGTPNYAFSTVTGATVDIQRRMSDGSFLELPNSPISVYDALPSQTYGSTQIPAASLGLGVGSTFQDGIYLITYNVLGNSSGAYTLTTQQYYVHDCGIYACYQKAVLAMSKCNCVCDGIDKRTQDIAMYWQSLQAAKRTGNLSEIQEFIDLLTKLCAAYGGCDC